MLYGIRIYKRGFLLNIILTIQIVISIILVNLTLGKYNMQMQSIQLFSDLADLKGVYYMPGEIFEYIPDDHQHTSEPKFDELLNIESIAGIQKIAFVPENQSEPIDTVVYDDTLIDKFPSFFKPDVWKNKDNPSDSVPVIVLSDLYEDECTSGKMTLWADNHESSTYVEIIGKSSVGNKYLNFGASGAISCIDLFPLYNDRFKEAPLFLTTESAIIPYKSSVYFEYSCKMIFFNQEITDAEINHNLELLQKTGSVKSFAELYNDGIQRASSDMQSLLSVALCVFVISLVGMVSMVILNMVRFLPTFSIFYICGCKWIGCLKIILVYLLLICGPAVLGIFLVALASVLSDAMFNMQLIINSFNILTTFAMLVLVVFLSISSAYILLKKNSPIQILHEKAGD